MECSAERCQNCANTLMALFVVFSSDLCMAHATKFLHLAAQGKELPQLLDDSFTATKGLGACECGDDCLKTMCERWIASLVIPSKCKPGCQSHQNCCSGMGQINDWIQPTVTVDGLELQDLYCCCSWL